MLIIKSKNFNIKAELSIFELLKFNKELSIIVLIKFYDKNAGVNSQGCSVKKMSLIEASLREPFARSNLIYQV